MRLLLVVGIVFSALPLVAQTEPAAPSVSAAAVSDPTKIPEQVMQSPIFSTLSAGDKTKFSDDFTKAMTDNPELVKQGMDLFAMAKGNPGDADRLAMETAFKTYFDKVRAAVIAEDSTIEPVLVRIDQQMAKLKAEGGDIVPAL